MLFLVEFLYQELNDMFSQCLYPSIPPSFELNCQQCNVIPTKNISTPCTVQQNCVEANQLSGCLSLQVQDTATVIDKY